MEQVLSAPIIIPQIPVCPRSLPKAPRFSEEFLDEYREESAEIYVEPTPAVYYLDTMDLFEDTMSPFRSHIRPSTPLLPSRSWWERYCCCSSS